MRLLRTLLILYLFIGCGVYHDDRDNSYLDLIEEYFYSEYLKIDDCYRHTPNPLLSDNNYNKFLNSKEDPLADSIKGLISDHSYPDLLFSKPWNEIFPSYSIFFDCRSFRLMIKNSWFILLRKGSSMKSNDSLGVTFNLPNMHEKFKTKAIEAIGLFFEDDVFFVEPIWYILNSSIISSFKYIDYEESVLSGESHLSERIGPDKTIRIIEYDSALINGKDNRAVLFIRSYSHRNWNNYLYFFEKISSRWNVLFHIEYPEISN